MKTNDRPTRDDEIVRLFRNGDMSKAAIGRAVGLRPPRVHSILLERGAIAPGGSRHVHQQVTDGIWDADEDRRRRAFYERARRGARQALEGMKT